ncbi:nitroreductase family protein [Paenibacillus tarimensis]|uniref:nitroreductase family protein n=1 Tax=Paenibacillus tarimensis TaxID=416012 RepID=UPI001F434CC1|nr:nitroreductase [Paenibacillus tarimensis]MCF2944671.1 nitroreductase [Paenibacillus tarimensis]
MISEAIRQRRAVRQFDGRPVEKKKIEALLETAVWAPNDRLREPWHFYVIQGDAKKRYEEAAERFLQERFPTKPKLVEESLKVLYTIPALIIVTADTLQDDADSTEDNVYAACCAAYNIWLAAAEQGLGCVWRTRGIGLVRDERLRSLLNCPAHRKIIGTLCIGYAAEEPPVTKRTPAAEKTTWLD